MKRLNTKKLIEWLRDLDEQAGGNTEIDVLLPDGECGDVTSVSLDENGVIILGVESPPV
jgi:hypothetical protein